jgi:hypothetical protein
MMRVTATTGAAASLIDGSTVHTALGIPVIQKGIKVAELDAMGKGKKQGDVTKKMENEWARVNYLVVDEVSMLDLALLSNMNLQCQGVKKQGGPGKEFWGVNVLFVGDFYQHKPVRGRSRFDQLAAPAQGVHPHEQRDIRDPVAQPSLWKNQFDTVIILDEQMRLNTLSPEGKTYRAFLNRLRHGLCTDADVALLKSRCRRYVVPGRCGGPKMAQSLHDSNPQFRPPFDKHALHPATS